MLWRSGTLQNTKIRKNPHLYIYIYRCLLRPRTNRKYFLDWQLTPMIKNANVNILSFTGDNHHRVHIVLWRHTLYSRRYFGFTIFGNKEGCHFIGLCNNLRQKKRCNWSCYKDTLYFICCIFLHKNWSGYKKWLGVQAWSKTNLGYFLRNIFCCKINTVSENCNNF